MSRNRNRRGSSTPTPTVEVTVNDAKAAPVVNDLASAIGLGGGMIPTGFPGNQGSPLSEQVSQPTTIFKNLRWYLVSNMRQVLSEAYVELGLVQAIVDLPVDDGLRGGIEIKSQQLEETQIEELLVSLDRDNDLVIAGQAAKWNRLFGGAGIIILTDQDPEEPLDVGSIGPDTPLEFRAVDMWELFWDKQNTEGYDPTIQEESFETYNYYGEPIHKSRVMRLKGIEAPSFIRPRLRGWGFSVVEILVRSINQYLKATDLAFEVLDEFKVDVFKIKNLTGSLFSDVGERAIQRRVQLANFQKNYQNSITMDSEDDWDHKQLSFAGLGDAMLQIRMQVASDMRMPLTKLFGISAAGFNSGEDDIEVYNAMVESQVRNKLKYDLLRICEIKCQKLFGFIPDDMSLSFKPLRVMSAEQEENVKNAKFARLLQALQAGLIDQAAFKDGVNKENLLGVTLDKSQDTLDGFEDDTAGDDKGEDTDDPGSSRADSEKPKAAGTGGAPKPLAKAPVVKSKEAPQAKTANAGFDESKHSRADDGKFGAGGGSAEATAFAKKYPATSGSAFHSKGTKDEATTKARKLREEGVHATIAHMEGPKTGDKSHYYVMVPESKKNAPVVMPKSWNKKDRILRTLLNSSAFDLASYHADGGDDWIDERREELFDGEKAMDKALWEKAKEAGLAALGRDQWQFVVWWYKKQGGKFH